MRPPLRSLIFAATIFAFVPHTIAQTTHPAATQPAIAADVPVKSVVLFSSGVGYFEHFGTVTGDSTTELRFKTNQINDILKSLILQDMDGGSVGAITYPSQDPIAKTLRSFQVDITANPPLAELLNQLRGARVTLGVTTEKITGTILGVETKQRVIGGSGGGVGGAAGGTPVPVSVLNLLAGATIRSIPLDDVREIQLGDPQLEDELNKALTALAQARDQDKKPVTINFRGQGDRRVRVGYVVETPIWKTSYRLILPGSAPGADQKPRLQGWAIVENQTDNDWNNVQLSLVSGRPISFVENLYQPLYIPRPIVQPELYASLRPQTYDAGIEESNKPMAFAAASPAAPKFALQSAQGQASNRKSAQAGLDRSRTYDVQDLITSPPMDASASIASVASAAKVGELFEYTVGNVSLPRQKSAMLPIITDAIEVEKLSIYNQSVLARNPLNGARVKNTTDKHLLQGPITVLDGSTYAGDARIDNLPPGQERLLSYGIDLQMLVDATKIENDSAIQSGHIIKGILYITRKFVSSQNYVADNKSDKDKTLIIEHPRREAWSLVDTTKPIETTDALYRFKGAVPAGKSTKLTVKEQLVQDETIEILPGDISQLDVYSRTGEIPQNVRDALAKAVQLKNAMVDTQRQVQAHDEQLAAITAEQGRIRENMKTVAPQSQYYTRLMKKLDDQESSIEKLQTEKSDLQKQADTQKKALEDYLGNLTVG